jgi:hypothetical protein
MRSNRCAVDRVRRGLLALGLAALTVSGAWADDDDDDMVLKWKTMAAVQRPYLGAANPVDGVGGGNAQWAINKGWGHLTKSGALTIHVRGLVLPEPPFNGVNVVPDFRALVVCRSADAAGNAVRIETFSGLFPASEAGDSDIETTLALPTPCVAPTVFVMHPDAPRWFATPGYN